MAEKPNKNSNKLSFKDFYTAEYRPGEDESINYRAYRRKRTDEGIKPIKPKPKRITQVDVDQKKRDLKVATMNNQIRSLNRESSEEWAKSQEKIKKKRRDAMLKPGDKEKINKIKDMMKNANEAKDDPCWDSHKQIGMKKKNGKKVPNCVPKESYSLAEIMDILERRGYKAQSIANKRKASLRMRVGKVKHKAKLGKRRAMRRMATQSVLKRRSRKQEWRNAFKKLAKGRSKKDMSIAQIQSIEKKLERPVWNRIVNRKSVIGIKDKRRLEIARKKGTWKK